MSVALVGIDVGGTFTDGVLLDGGVLKVAKVATRAGEQWRSVLEAIEALGANLAETSIRHGTTVVTNAVLERKGARTALVTTRGHRDVLEIQRAVRRDLYDIQADKPEPLVPRRLRFEVDERVNWRGDVLRAPTDGQIQQLANDLRAVGAEAIAISFLHSYVNDTHERMVAETLRLLLGEVDISVSSEVSPQFREYERTCTVVVNAYVKRNVADYLSRLAGALAEGGYTRELLIMQSNGGMAPPDALISRPVHAILSGPAAGSMAAAYVGALTGSPKVIGLDVGGTSADVSVSVGGVPELGTSYEIEKGVSLQVSSRNIYTIGAGGGSVGWIDVGGRLRVGPRSAGSEPGPACYGRGGTEPTVTDANLVLGRLNPDYFLGGQMSVSVDAAKTAIESLEIPGAQMDIFEKATGMLRIVEANMMDAIRLISVRRGHDLRDFVLVAFGGAGPLHASSIARDLNIPKVVVFPHPGVLSALGLLVVDVRHDYARTLMQPLSAGDLETVERAFMQLEEEARNQLQRDGFAPAGTVLERSLDLRYEGQSFEITVGVERPATAATLNAARGAFDLEHGRLRGHSAPADPCEIVNVRVTGTGLTERPRVDVANGHRGSVGAAVKGHRRVFLDQPWGWTDCTIYDREKIPRESHFKGPAVVEELDSTTLVFPSWSCDVDSNGILTVSSGGA